MMAVVRLFAGEGWRPREISLSSPGPVPPLAHELFPNTRVLAGRPSIYFTIPRCLVGLPPRHRTRSPSSAVPQAGPSGDLIDSLRRLLPAYLRSGSPPIELVAEIAGTSVRSFQRHLSRAGLSYSALVEQVRLEVASAMLAEPEASSIEIAYELGYTDPSNFARAFRRMTGVSPREYRRQSRAS